MNGKGQRMIAVTFFSEVLIMPPIPLDHTDEAAPGGARRRTGSVR